MRPTETKSRPEGTPEARPESERTTTATTRSGGVSLRLVAAVLVMTLVVLGLGGAVIALKLRPEAPPATKAERDVRMWEQEIKTHPDDDWAQVGLGLALEESNRDAEARKAFEAALELNPDNWLALFRLGLQIAPNDGGRAAEMLERSAKSAPDTSKAAPYVALGDLLLDAGDYEGARKAYRGAISDVPYLFDARVGLAQTLEALGDPEGALEQYREAIKYNPGSQEVADSIARLEGGAG